MKVKNRNYTTKLTHLINIATVFDYFYKDIELSKDLKEQFKQLFYKTYTDVKNELIKRRAEYEKKIRRV